jgi:Ca-activated chloride channel homolog
MRIFSRSILPLALTAFTLSLGGCSTTANQQVNLTTGSPVGENGSPLTSGQNTALFRALGGVGLNPTVALFCNNENVAGDRGYARQVARTYRAYLNQLLSETTGGNGSQTGSVYGIDPLTGVPVQMPSPTPAPEATATPNPFPTAQDDISTVEKTTFNGKIFDDSKAPIDGVKVTARSLNPSVVYEVETTTAGGTFAFNNAPAGVQIEIVVSRPGYSTVRRVEVLTSNKQGDPNANRFDFGTGEDGSDFGAGFNAITDKPQVTQVEPGRNSSGISPETPVVLTFSEPVDRASVERNFALCIQPTGSSELQVAYALADFTVNWSSDDSQVTFTPRPGVKLNSGERYAIGFKAGDGIIKDKSGISRSEDHFKLTDGRYEAGSYFTVEGDFQAQQFNAQQATFQPLPPPAKVRDSFYFSYDDSASTASVELFKHAMSNNQLPNPAWSKTWEFLNYEQFDQLEQESLGLFKASMGLWKYPHQQNPYLDTYEVGIHLSAPYKCKATRQQMVLTVLLDVSTSMYEPSSQFSKDGSAIPSKQTLAIEGLKAMTAQLKAGDQVSLILFNNKVKTVLDSFTVGQDSEAMFARALDEIKLEGGTNLQTALGAAYELAEKHYDTRKMNRILFMTDAQATEGNVDMGLVRAASATDNGRPIYLSGLGMGFGHDNERMNRITEEGHGAYYSINTLTDMQEAMGDRFIPLMDVIARNVRFQIEFPGFMRHNKSASEELSANPSQVQPTNFSANTSQYFWEQFLSNKTDFTGNEKVVLTITYEDPRSRQQKTERLEKTLAEILDKDLQNIKAAHMVSLTTALVRREVSATDVREELERLLPDVGR